MNYSPTLATIREKMAAAPNSVIEALFAADEMQVTLSTIQQAEQEIVALRSVLKAALKWQDLMASDVGSDEQRLHIENEANTILSTALDTYRRDTVRSIARR